MNRLAGIMWFGSLLTVPVQSTRPEVLAIAQRDVQQLNASRPTVDISANGRFVAFTSYARLVPADTNDARDVYVLDRVTRGVTLESAVSGDVSARDSDNPDLSGDGRYLVYEAQLISIGEATHIILRDRRESTVRILSRGPSGEPANGSSRAPSISEDGHVVAFASAATNLVAGTDPNGASDDVYTADVVSGTVRRINSPASAMSVAHGWSVEPSINRTGRYIAFVSTLDFDSDGGERDSRVARGVPSVFVHDAQIGVTSPVSVGRGGRQANGASWAPAISGDGRYVAFVSGASNLIADDRNEVDDVFVADWRAGTMELVSGSTGGRSGNDASGGPAISADGRFVAFQSEASNLICPGLCGNATEDINLVWDVFLWDRQARSMTRISGDAAGPWMEASVGAALDAAARVVAFSSRHPIDAADRHNDFDLFVVTR